MANTTSKTTKASAPKKATTPKKVETTKVVEEKNEVIVEKTEEVVLETPAIKKDVEVINEDIKPEESLEKVTEIVKDFNDGMLTNETLETAMEKGAEEVKKVIEAEMNRVDKLKKEVEKEITKISNSSFTNFWNGQSYDF